MNEPTRLIGEWACKIYETGARGANRVDGRGVLLYPDGALSGSDCYVPPAVLAWLLEPLFVRREAEPQGAIRRIVAVLAEATEDELAAALDSLAPEKRDVLRVFMRQEPQGAQPKGHPHVCQYGQQPCIGCMGAPCACGAERELYRGSRGIQHAVNCPQGAPQPNGKLCRRCQAPLSGFDTCPNGCHNDW